MPSDYLVRAAQQLTRDWKRGKITQEEYVHESLKLSARMKEEQYLRVASLLLDAKKRLIPLVEQEPIAYDATVEWNQCIYCGGNDVHHALQVMHEPSCPWMLAKTWLEEQGK